jgi:hypothetical protein
LNCTDLNDAKFAKPANMKTLVSKLDSSEERVKTLARIRLDASLGLTGALSC